MTALVGRDAELAVIDAELDGTRTGASRVVLIPDDAGTGKSWWLDELFARASSAGLATIVGRVDNDDRPVASATLRLASVTVWSTRRVPGSRRQPRRRSR